LALPSLPRYRQQSIDDAMPPQWGRESCGSVIEHLDLLAHTLPW
jgi:hypothetical protein